MRTCLSTIMRWTGTSACLILAAAAAICVPEAARADLGPASGKDVAVREQSVDRPDRAPEQTSSTGEVRTSYPFDLPPARGRYTPSLTLQYGSFRPTGPVGVGWQLSVSYVERVWNATPQPDPAAPGSVVLPRRYALTRGDTAQELLPVTATVWRAAVARDQFDLTRQDNVWTGADERGNHYRFGAAVERDGLGCQAPESCSRWYLDQVTDPDGNVTRWDYEFAGAGAVLREIRYNEWAPGSGTFATRVSLAYEPEDEPQSNRAAHGLATTDQRLVQVGVRQRREAAGPEALLRRYVLRYERSTETRRSLLAQVQLLGIDGSAGPLPTRYEYTGRRDADAPSFAGFDNSTLTTDDDVPGNWCPSFCHPAVEWLDLDADARPDLVQGEWWARNLSPYGGARLTFGPKQRHGCYNSMGQPTTWTIQQQHAACVDVTGDRLPDMVTATGSCSPGGAPPGLQIIPAQPHPDGPTLGGGYDVVAGGIGADYCARLGSGAFGLTLRQTSHYRPDRDQDDDLAVFQDLNGDQLPDLVVAGATGGWSAGYGHRDAAGRFALSEPVSVDAPYPWIRRRIETADNRDRSLTSYDLADVNGDGLADRLEAIRWSAANTVWDVALGQDGRRFRPAPVRFAMSDRTVGPVTEWGKKGVATEIINSGLADLNGDGLLDYVAKSASGDGVCGADHAADCPWVISWNSAARLAAGSGFGTAGHKSLLTMPAGFDLRYEQRAPADLSPWGSSIGLPWSNSRVSVGGRLLDANGDGVLDYVTEDWLFGSLPIQFFRGRPAAAGPPDLLAQVISPRRARTRYTYAPSSTVAAAGATGRYAGPVMPVLTRREITGPALQPVQERYWYAGPVLAVSPFDAARTESRGYADTWTLNETTAQITHVTWATGYGMGGRAVVVERGTAVGADPNAAAPPFTWAQRTETSFAARSWRAGAVCPEISADGPPAGDMPLLVHVAAQIDRTRTDGHVFATGSRTSCPKLAVDASGVPQVLQTSSMTDPDLAVGRDGARETRRYDPESPCRSCPVQVTVTDESDTILGQQRHYYDAPYGLTSPTLAYGRAGHGRLTRTDTLVTLTPSVSRENGEKIAYNPDGTVRYRQQARPSSRTDYAYDPARVRVVQVVVSGPGVKRLQTDTVTDARGLVLSVTGPYLPGGAKPATHYAYDAFARPIAVSRSPFTDQSSDRVIALMSYADTSAPYAERTIKLAAAQRAKAGEMIAPLDAFRDVTVYYDGLGRAVQEREQLGRDPGGAARSRAGVVRNPGPGLVRVTGVRLYDAAGRTTATLDAFLSHDNSYRDYTATSGRPADALPGQGVRGHAFGYDELDRIICDAYGPGPAAARSPGNCRSVLTDGPEHVSAVRTRYSAQSLDGRTYLGVQTYGAAHNTGRNDAFRTELRDPAGRVHTVLDTAGNPTRQHLDPLGRVVVSARHTRARPGRPVITRRFSYDLAGRVVRDTDPTIGDRRYTYLPTGDMASTTWQPAGAGASYRLVTSTDYADLGRQNRITMREQQVRGGTWTTVREVVRTLHYDQLPSALARWVPATGYGAGRLVAVQQGEQATAFTYDDTGNVVERAQWHDGYAAAPYRLVRHVRADGGVLSTAVHEPGRAAPTRSYTIGYDTAGRPVRAVTGGHVVWEADAAVGYDASNRLLTYRMDDGAVNGVWAYSPNTGLLIDRSVRLRGQVLLDWRDHRYAGSALTSVSGPAPAERTEIGYDTDDAVTDWTWRHGSTLRQQISRNIDNTFTVGGAGIGQIERFRTCLAAGCLDEDYRYLDPVQPERLSRITGQGLSRAVETFTYDPLGTVRQRHVRAALSVDGRLGPRTSIAIRRWLGLAPGGQLDKPAVVAMQQIVRAHPDGVLGRDTVRQLQRWLTQQGFAVCPDGRLGVRTVSALQRFLNAGVTDTFGYDLEQRLTTLRIANGTRQALQYDGLGQLSRQITDSPSGRRDVRWLADDATITVEPGRARSITLNVKIGTVPVAVSGPGTTTFLHRDRQGSVAAVTSADGRRGVEYRYDAYGRRLTGTAAAYNPAPYGFLGAVVLPADLLLLRERLYDPRSRAFLQPDLASSDGYRFAGGDPVNRIDPSGADDEDHESGLFAPAEGKDVNPGGYGSTSDAGGIENLDMQTAPEFTPAQEGAEAGDYVFADGQWQEVGARVDMPAYEIEGTRPEAPAAEQGVRVDAATGLEKVKLWHKEEAFGMSAPRDVALEHWWIETPTNSFGMGPAGGTGTEPAAGQRGSWTVGINPHSSVGKTPAGTPAPGYYVTYVYGPPGFTQKVDSYARSQQLGKFGLCGTCQTFATQVLLEAGAVQVPERFGSAIYLDLLLGGNMYQQYGP